MRQSKRFGFAMGSIGATGMLLVSCGQGASESAQSQDEPLGRRDFSAECAAEAAPLPGNPPQHPDPCHGNPNFAETRTLLTRGE